jgi:uncharacterized phage-associated protein
VEHSAATVANAFLSLAASNGSQLTNMQVQKLVYIAHGYCLAALRSPLTYNNVHAWQYGPVIPKLYKQLAKYGAGVVTHSINTDDPSISEASEQFSIIKAVWEGYGHFSGGKLSGITHQDGSPWSITWAADPYGVIPPSLIADHYKSLLDAESK